MKSVKPGDGRGEPPDQGGGRNRQADFHGQKRTNQTHASTTDPEARLYKKGRGKQAKLCFIGHGLMENRHGLLVDACLTLADGKSERVAALAMIEARAVELLSDLPDYQLLTTIPGIGPINAMTILAEAGDLRLFRHHRQFLKFCGMDLATVQSGMFRGRSRISKYGNARLRRTLWMAGQIAVLKQTNSFRDKFERYISKDRHNVHLRQKAYTAIAAKMARTVHAVVKHDQPYRPFFEGAANPGGRTSL